MSRPIALLAAMVALLGAVACDKVPLLAPTQSTITLTANTTTLPVNGSAQVVASVTEQSGTPPQNGTVVTFTSSFGTVEPAEARTEGGKATVTFRAGSQSGVAKIGAFSGAARATEIEVRVGGAAAGAVSVRAEPSSIPQSGGTVQVIAIVTDASGNPLSGAPVIFTTDAGSLANNSGVTDQNGELRTALTTNRATKVTATVSDKRGEFTIAVANLPTVTISSSTTSPVAGVPVAFTVNATAATGGAGIQTVAVDFGDGTAPTSLGAISGNTGVSHIYARDGSYTVTVTVTDLGGLRNSSSMVVVISRASLGVSITGPTAPVPFGTNVSLAITVTNPSSVPLASLTVSFGDGTQTTLAATTGSVTVNKLYTTAGTFMPTATVRTMDGTSASSSTTVIVTPLGAVDVTIAVASYIPGNGSPTTPNPACGTATVGVPQCTIVIPTSQSVTVALQAMVPSLTGGEVVTSYVWGFGDGTSATTGSPRAEKLYSQAGTYVVSVTARTSFNRNLTGQMTLVLQAASSLPPFDLTFDVSSMRITPSGGTAAPCGSGSTTCTSALNVLLPANVLFQLAAPTLQSGESIMRIDWNFGQGSTSSTTSRNTDFTYSAKGTYAVSATATTSLGRSSTARVTVTIQ